MRNVLRFRPSSFAVKSLRQLMQVALIAVALMAGLMSAQAQVTTGNVRGTVTDPNGAAVPNAKVTITKKSTNTSTSTQTTGSGEYQFNNLLAGDDYAITVEAGTLPKAVIRIQKNGNDP